MTLDTSAVTFIDCTGLGVLIAARQALSQLGIALLLRAPSPAVLRLLRLTDTGAGFDVVDPHGT